MICLFNLLVCPINVPKAQPQSHIGRVCLLIFLFLWLVDQLYICNTIISCMFCFKTDFNPITFFFL